MNNIVTWIKSNPLIAAIIGFVAVVIFFPRTFGRLFGSPTRRAKRRSVRATRRLRRRFAPRTRIRFAPRLKIKRSGAKRRRSTAKKPWQIKGSLAAKRRMAQIRRRRRA